MAGTVKFARGQGKTVNLSGIAGIMGVDVNTIRKCLVQGMPHKKLGERKYEFDTAKCIHWRLQQEANKADEKPVDMSIDEARRRKEVASALIAEIDLAKARESVANIDDLMVNFNEALASVRAQIIAMPNRLAGVLEHQSNKEIRKILTEDLSQVLDGLSEYEHRYQENQ